MTELFQVPGVVGDVAADAVLVPGAERLDIKGRPARLETVGAFDVLAERVQLVFGYPVASPGQTALHKGTVIVMEPVVEGSWRFVNPSVLAFVPAKGFVPGSTVTIRVEALELSRSVLEGVTPVDGSEDGLELVKLEKPWAYAVKSPQFELKDITATRPETGNAAIVVEMNFTAPVVASKIGAFAGWEIDGRAPARVTYKSGGAKHQVVASVTLARDHVKPTTLTLDWREGLAYESTKTFAAAKKLVAHVEQGKAMKVVTAQLVEGSQNFYVDLACNDEAVKGRRYDYRLGEYVSARCDIDTASATRAIEIYPPIPFRISPSAQGMHVFADFQQGSYTVRFRAGLRSEEGSILRESFERTFEVPALTASVNFTAKGRYIPRSAWNEMTIRHRNLGAVDLLIRHVPGHNLAFWMSSYHEGADERTSDVVLQTRLALKNVADQALTTVLPIEELLGKAKAGIYEINVSGPSSRDAVRVLVTDINLVVKRSAERDAKASESVDVWAVHMETLAPLKDTKVRALRPSGSTLARCTTDAKGHCRLSFAPDAIDKTPPYAIMATLGEDTTYLKYSELRTELARGEVHGLSYLDAPVYGGYLYADRDLYRPGDTVHLVGLLRDTELKAVSANMPVELVISDPRGQLVRRLVTKTNAAGMVSLDYALSDLAATGSWRARLDVGKQALVSLSFGVEEFVPERLRAEAAPKSAHYVFGEPALIEVSARYLFGASAKGSEVELQCQIQPVAFEPKQNAQFHYGALDLNEETRGTTLNAARGVIGADDKTTVACGQVEGPTQFPSTGRLRASVAVSEAGSGRATHTSTQAMLHPERYYLGLRSERKKLEVGEQFRVEGVVVDWAGEVSSALKEVEVEFVSLMPQWGYFEDNHTGHTRYKRQWRLAVERAERVPVTKGKFTITASAGAARQGYLVRVKAGKARTDLRFEGTQNDWHWQGASNGNDATPRPLKPGSVDFTAPTSVALGRAQQLQFTSPFKGRALLTLETHEVIEHAWLDVEAGPHTWTFQLENFAPNVYVSALIIKDPHLESPESFMPERAFGATSMTVERTQFTQKISLSAPKEMRPDNTLVVKLDVGKNEGKSFVTVAVVDEGILRLTGYKSPNPLDTLLARRALGVTTFDTVGWSVQLPQMGESARAGGGDDDDEGQAGGPGRIMPFKPVAIWSGLLAVPKSGKLDVKLPVPLYQGDVRVMAVVVGPERIGTAQTNVLVRDPLSVQATLPRFLTVTDEVKIPVFVSNLTPNDHLVDVTISASELAEPGLTPNPKASPIIGILGEQKRQILVASGQSETVVFRARALRSGGAATFEVVASAGDLKSRAEGVVPFRAAGPRERIVTSTPILASSVDLKPMLEGWAPTSESSTFWVTPVPHAQAFDHLSYLVRYPYGCLEQTTSSTRPLLFISNLVRQVDPGAVARGGSIEKMVLSGINRVLSMQHPGGGFGYWHGGSYTSLWAGAYATHMLMDARDQGYEVPRERIEDALKWLASSVTSADNNHSAAYVHYVLAVAGRGNQGQIRRAIQALPAQLTGQHGEDAYLLKAALYLAGDRSFESELKQPGIQAPTEVRNTGYTYYSDRRRRAVILNVFFDLFGNHPGGEALAEAIAKDLSSDRPSRWYTTQEIIWSVTGLGKWYRDSLNSSGKAALVANGRTLEPVETKGRTEMNWALTRASEYDQLHLDVTAQEGRLYLMTSSEGVRDKPNARYGGTGLTITREYLNADGTPLGPKQKLGDLAYVRIQLTNTSPTALTNVALVDRLPAGWEIENPRLGRDTLPNWARNKKLWASDHLNMRDDRLETFGGLKQRETVELIYAARATLAGTFHVPSVEAEGMYDPDVWARAPMGSIEIEGPWSELVD
ncbi:MAG: hypothetical protein H0U74_04855 [Bradymonadaceae bacterium]|nr:hypothetical protein [Lujinxingiaceae bacterium]